MRWFTKTLHPPAAAPPPPGWTSRWRVRCHSRACAPPHVRRPVAASVRVCARRGHEGRACGEARVAQRQDKVTGAATSKELRVSGSNTSSSSSAPCLVFKHWCGRPMNGQHSQNRNEAGMSSSAASITGFCCNGRYPSISIQLRNHLMKGQNLFTTFKRFRWNVGVSMAGFSLWYFTEFDGWWKWSCCGFWQVLLRRPRGSRWEGQPLRRWLGRTNSNARLENLQRQLKVDG